MPNQVNISKTRAVIRAILLLRRRKVLRTELVKLVYLADNRFYESTGRTITGNTYRWDHFGPNAVSGAIVDEANAMADEGMVLMSARPSMHGGSAYPYWIRSSDQGSAWKTVESALDAGERQVVRDIVKQFGQMGLESLIRRSKATVPFAEASRYGILTLQQNQQAEVMRSRMDKAGEFLEDAEAGLRDADAGEWVSDEQLMHS